MLGGSSKVQQAMRQDCLRRLFIRVQNAFAIRPEPAQRHADRERNVVRRRLWLIFRLVWWKRLVLGRSTAR